MLRPYSQQGNGVMPGRGLRKEGRAVSFALAALLVSSLYFVCLLPVAMAKSDQSNGNHANAICNSGNGNHGLSNAISNEGNNQGKKRVGSVCDQFDRDGHDWDQGKNCCKPHGNCKSCHHPGGKTCSMQTTCVQGTTATTAPKCTTTTAPCAATTTTSPCRTTTTVAPATTTTTRLCGTSTTVTTPGSTSTTVFKMTVTTQPPMSGSTTVSIQKTVKIAQRKSLPFTGLNLWSVIAALGLVSTGGFICSHGKVKSIR